MDLEFREELVRLYTAFRAGGFRVTPKATGGLVCRGDQRLPLRRGGVGHRPAQSPWLEDRVSYAQVPVLIPLPLLSRGPRECPLLGPLPGYGSAEPSPGTVGRPCLSSLPPVHLSFPDQPMTALL